MTFTTSPCPAGPTLGCPTTKEAPDIGQKKCWNLQRCCCVVNPNKTDCGGLFFGEQSDCHWKLLVVVCYLLCFFFLVVVVGGCWWLLVVVGGCCCCCCCCFHRCFVLFQHSPLQLLPLFCDHLITQPPDAKTAALPVGGGPPSVDGMRRALEVS